MFSYMQLAVLRLIVVISLSMMVSSSLILVPRSPKGGGSGGGGHASGGGGRSSGSSSGRGSTSSGVGRGGSGDTGFSAVSYSSINTGGRDANFFGGGGGRPITLPSTSIFPGRQMGGGSRAQVPGTRSYGSGYPYSNGDIGRNGVAGQPFPFGFWPIYWSGHGHSDEYGQNETVASQRPGGEQVIVELAPNTGASWNTSSVNGISETYWMIGDKESVTALLSLLTDIPVVYPYGCDVQNKTIEPFDSSNASNPVNYSNVIQYYRDSSFALAYEGYNNTLALTDTTGIRWNDSTPLPTEQIYSPFLQCINATITAGLPILDQAEPKFSGWTIAGIVIGSLIGAAGLYCCIQPCIAACMRSRKQKKEAEQRKRESAKQATYYDSAVWPPSDRLRNTPSSSRTLTPIPTSEKGNGSPASSSTFMTKPPQIHLDTRSFSPQL